MYFLSYILFVLCSAARHVVGLVIIVLVIDEFVFSLMGELTSEQVDKERGWRVDEEMGLAGKHEPVLLWIRIEVLE